MTGWQAAGRAFQARPHRARGSSLGGERGRWSHIGCVRRTQAAKSARRRAGLDGGRGAGLARHRRGAAWPCVASATSCYLRSSRGTASAAWAAAQNGPGIASRSPRRWKGVGTALGRLRRCPSCSRQGSHGPHVPVPTGRGGQPPGWPGRLALLHWHVQAVGALTLHPLLAGAVLAAPQLSSPASSGQSSGYGVALRARVPATQRVTRCGGAAVSACQSRPLATSQRAWPSSMRSSRRLTRPG